MPTVAPTTVNLLSKRQQHERALRHALWIAMVLAKDLDLTDVEHQLTTIFVLLSDIESGESTS